MKKDQRTADGVRAEIAQAAKALAYDRSATPGSQILTAHIYYLRRLLKELAACKEE